MRIRLPLSNRHGNSPSHSGSPFASSKENDGGHFQDVDASSNENESFGASEENNNNSEGNVFHGHSQEGINQVNNDVSNLRSSSRPFVFSRNFNDFVVDSKVKYGLEKFVNYSHLSKRNYCFATMLNKSFKPKTYLEASEHKHWVDAMNADMDALLVAKGFIQREGIDFDETFSPVVKIVTIRRLINLAVQSGWSLFQIDINNAFLYGDLNDMTLPHGYFSADETKVCKLNKLLYGLKQAPRQLNDKLTSALLENDFVQSKSDYSLFTKSFGGVFIALLVYVDDIIIIGNSLPEINKVKQFLKTKFMIKDLGKLKYFLGIEVLDTFNGVCLNQRKYCLELIDDLVYLLANHLIFLCSLIFL
ncbi:ribonuclease H-like domain-containing protein [Tanacetum coccineum]